MLAHIHIRNFATIEALELEFGPGMTVLTGETGAGKSIVLDALGLALGDRADSAVIRHGAERAEIGIGFDIGRCPAAQDWLAGREMDADGECLIRRTIGADGRSKGFINGQPVPMQSLRELGELLVDIHGQHSHQSLFRSGTQRQVLDDYAGHGTLLAELAASFRRWEQIRDELDALHTARQDRDARLDLLRHQVHELKALELGADELQSLEEEHKRQANASELIEGCQLTYERLYGAEQGSALELLTQSCASLQQLSDCDPQLAGIGAMLDNAQLLVEEAATDLRRHLDHLEIDPQRLAWLEQRLADIQALARKHRCRAEELPELLQRLDDQLQGLERLDVQCDSLERELTVAADGYRALAKKLSAGRRGAAKRLGALVAERMQQLGMAGGRFEITLQAREPEQFSAGGLERVEFQVSANPGQPLQPLNKVASGGELSRIGLALQVIVAQTARIPTLIFDEVDVGIGGGTAEIVGHLLRQLGAHQQVLCVTHQPQVAVLAHHHLQVSKQTARGATHTRVGQLEHEQRIEEIARMLGGIEITPQTLSHAREMLMRAQHV